MTTAATKEPSEEFMTALKELKLIWTGSAKDWNNDNTPKQYQNFIELGKKEGLSFHFVDYKLNEITTKCNECNEQITIHRKHDEQFCPSCYEKKQRQEWLEECEEEKRKEDPIERYCHKIRGTIPYYEQPFEFKPNNRPEEAESFGEQYKRIMSGDTKNDREEAMREEWARRKEEQRYKDVKNNPAGMTKTQWIKEGRRKRQLEREEDKQDRLDDKFKYRNTPISMFEDRIGKIRCECKAEEMRQGIYCKTCKLLVKVNDYMLSLFKDAAEGRSSVI